MYRNARSRSTDSGKHDKVELSKKGQENKSKTRSCELKNSKDSGYHGEQKTKEKHKVNTVSKLKILKKLSPVEEENKKTRISRILT